MKGFPQAIKNSLSGLLPGPSAQFRMAPKIRKMLTADIPEKKAAVLVLLFPCRNCISIAFIQRTRYDGPHSGQISFPGGVMEKVDKSYIDTAIRECYEETGVISKDIQVLGILSELKIPVSNFTVQPVVGFLDYCPEFKLDPREVEHMIIVPLSHLSDPGNILEETRIFKQETFKVPYFRYKNHKIWGATAMILSEFLTVIQGLEPDQYLPEGSGSDCNDT